MIRPRPIVLWVTGLVGLGFPTGGQIALARDIDFQRDVQPILAEHCAGCHGPDEAARQAGLRLDSRDMAVRGGDSGLAAIVPHKPEESELIQRVTSTDADYLMPPPHENKPLTVEQITVLTRWIGEGANYATHWAFVPPQKAPLPAAGPAHPVDGFVVSRLKLLELQPSPPAEATTLARRLYLDLIGLPPSPWEVEAFESDGFAATLDRLLESERFGEKWARHWLDAARYCDTNGYEKDMPRDQWIWRDWVIGALNRDLPYDQFLIEQIAGDLLPEPTQEQIVATGFLRNSMLNEEGAIDAEEFRMVEMFDRLDCLGKAVLGISAQCAQCHAHKFDPISQDEYFGLFAFLNNTYEAQSWVYTAEPQQQIRALEQAIEAVEERIRSQHPQWRQELAAWESEVLARQIAWTPLVATELGSVSGLNHPRQQADLSLLMRGHPSDDVFMICEPDLAGVTGLRLEALTHGDLPFGGPGRGPGGIWGITEIEASVKKPDSQDWEKLKLAGATADFSEPEQKEDEKTRGPVGFLVDGTDETSWEADRGIGRRNQPSVAVVQFEQPLDLPPGTRFKLALRTNDMLGCCRVSTTTATNPVTDQVAYAAVLAMQTPCDQRTTAQQAAVFSAWRRARPDWQAFSDEIEAQWQQFPTALTSVLHLAERQGVHVRQTHLLDRGSWNQPRQVIEPHTPAAFHPLTATDAPPRLAFARWLADAQSPLTARVAVNRVWQAMFGEGLVETSEDFGARAPVPEYRELLDWLAVDFMEHGWSQKHLIKTIATSATYQQSSASSAELRERDPRNRWLARGPRFRAEAEVVRDIALCTSGLISHKIGGPPIIPPVPQNVLDYNFTYPAYWIATEGADRYRRTLYAFRKRSMPDPVLSSFDAPNGDFSCARRVRSNTPLAALTSLNEIIFTEAAQAMALRVLREAGPDDALRADYAFRLCTSRPPSPAERDEILALLQSRRRRLAEGWLDIREISTGDSTKLPAIPANTTPQDAGAWTLVSRVLLNLDETITKN
ncbi:MAG: PSD1 and planctomycete cytochrome C domain-containing protein [Pirellulales bacterium]